MSNENLKLSEADAKRIFEGIQNAVRDLLELRKKFGPPGTTGHETMNVIVDDLTCLPGYQDFLNDQDADELEGINAGSQ